MKVVINRKFGGFSLSPRALARMAELQGRECHFSKTMFKGGKSHTVPISHAEAFDGEDSLFIIAMDVPDVEGIPGVLRNDEFYAAPMEKRAESNRIYSQHVIDCRPENRADPLLVQVVEELGEAANGRCAELKVVEIPDDAEYTIDDYDGMETIHEKHRSWA